jgi:NAD(P)-dependent dehydrogenase (short-subunit alcohol dehydrogenase family)
MGKPIALGTGGGIGLAAANQFVEESAYVFVTGRRERELAAAVKRDWKKCNRRAERHIEPCRSRSPLCSNQARKVETRCPIRQCWCREIRAVGLDIRSAL